MKKRKFNSKSLALYLKGMAMGAADVVPGVSGGTIAFIAGIYDELIHGIAQIGVGHLRALFFWLSPWTSKTQKSQSKKQLLGINWAFFVPLLAGILTAVLTLAKWIPLMMKEHPVETYSLFFGLILASVPVPLAGMKKGIKEWILVLLSAILMFFLMGFASHFEGSLHPIYLFCCGAIAICALILPGISGSYILVILGEYSVVLDALHQRDFRSLLIFVSGMIVGILSFIRLLRYFLNHKRGLTMSVLTGVMIGSLRVIWPLRFVGGQELSQVFVPILSFCLVGCLFVVILSWLGRRQIAMNS